MRNQAMAITIRDLDAVAVARCCAAMGARSHWAEQIGAWARTRRKDRQAGRLSAVAEMLEADAALVSVEDALIAAIDQRRTSARVFQLVSRRQAA